MKKTMIKGLAILLIVCQLAACPALAAGSVAYGEKNEEIVTMQKRLKELGYFAGECTGFFGEFTKTAIENFQKANGLVVNGEADAETLAAMEKDNAVTKKQYIENSQKGESIEITLQTGDTGKNVRKLQEYLIRLGYLKQVITETYDAGTEYAVRFFQLVNRLKVTGVADPETLNRLTSSSAISAEECVESAKMFLESRIPGEVQESYYRMYGGVLTVNMVPVESGILLYPDLIKVQVSMSDASVIGLEMKDYYRNHAPRALPERQSTRRAFSRALFAFAAASCRSAETRSPRPCAAPMCRRE